MSYVSRSQLDMGPFLLTQSNPIHQLMDPIQSNPIHGWIQSMSNSDRD